MNQRVVLAVVSSILVVAMSAGALRVRRQVAMRSYDVAKRLQGRDRARYLERSLDLEPGMTEARLDLAATLMDLGQYDRALHQLDQLIHARRDSWTVREAQGESLYQLGQYPQAEKALRTAAPLALSGGSQTSAEAGEAHVSRTHLYLGRTLEKLSQYPEAEGEYREAVTADPRSEEAYLDLGNLLLSHGTAGNAAAFGRQMIGVGREQARDWHRLLAQADLRAHRPEKAIQELKLASSADRASEKPFLDMAAVLISIGDAHQAAAVSATAARLAPGNAQAQLALASALEADKQWNRAVDVYRSIEKLQPQQFARWVAAGRGPVADNPALIAWQEKLEMLINPGDVHLMGPDSEPGIQQVWYAGDSGEHKVNLQIADALYVQGALAQVRKDYTGAGQFYQNALHFIPQAESPCNTVLTNRLREAIEEGIDSVLQSQLSGLPSQP